MPELSYPDDPIKSTIRLLTQNAPSADASASPSLSTVWGESLEWDDRQDPKDSLNSIDWAPFSVLAELSAVSTKLIGTQGPDFLSLQSFDTKKVDGRGQQDIVQLNETMWNSDIHIKGDKFIVTDRFSGQQTILKNIEAIEIAGIDFSSDSLRAAIERQDPLLFADGLARLKVNTTDPTPSVLWDQIAQHIVTESAMGPTLAARLYALVHTAIYDAFAAHDQTAVRVAFDYEGDNLHAWTASEEEQEEAMHYAGYTVLATLFPRYGDLLLSVLEERLGLEVDAKSLEAEIGRDSAEDVLLEHQIEFALIKADDAAQYQPQNPNPNEVRVIDAWTPEWLSRAEEMETQRFLTPEFALLKGFALPRNTEGPTDQARILPAAPEPFLLADFQGSTVDIETKSLALARDAEINGISYNAGDIVPINQTLIGAVINPAFIAQAQYIVEKSANLSPRERAVAEFWEDGPGTSFPPGTMMTLAQYASVRDNHTIAEDAVLFLAMGNAMMDAAIVSWSAKVHYDYARPVQVIRDLGALELIGEPGVDEITGQTGYVISTFAGYDPTTGESLGTRTILAQNFVTYQNPEGSYSPPFAEYVSGHSTFSSAAAAVLTEFSGSDIFGGRVEVAPQTSDFDVTFPTESLFLEWNSFGSLAIEAGQSRILGGIHFSQGNETGLILGKTVGIDALEMARAFSEGNVGAHDEYLNEWII